MWVLLPKHYFGREGNQKGKGIQAIVSDDKVKRVDADDSNDKDVKREKAEAQEYSDGKKSKKLKT